MTESPFSLDQQALIGRLCSSLGVQLSEYTFANLYLFRNIHQYRLVEIAPTQFGICGFSYEGTPYFMPLFCPDRWDACIKIAQSLNAESIFPIPESWFEPIQAQGYSLAISENDSDYLFDAEAIRTFRGRHYDGQRNMIRQLLSDHHVEAKRLTPDSLPEAIVVIDGWASIRQEPM